MHVARGDIQEVEQDGIAAGAAPIDRSFLA